MSPKPNIHIEKTEGAPESVALLARSIVQVSEAAAQIRDAGLTERALVLLLQDAIGPTHITKEQIRLVLDNLPRLRPWYVREGSGRA